MKFKPGDKIKAKKNTTAYRIYKDEILIVSGPENHFYNKQEAENGKIFYVEPFSNCKFNGWNAEYFELCGPKSELDYLDNIQGNFKDGV